MARDLVAQMQGLRVELEDQGSELRQQFFEAREANAQTRAEFAEAARRGERGSDWQVLQRRIDLNQTTVDDILYGGDDSPEAERLRATMVANTDHIAELQQVDDDTEQTATREEIFGQVRASQREIMDLLEQIRERPPIL
ncbi:hypothetical protein ACQP1U_11650 [Actinomycetota bacterium]